LLGFEDYQDKKFKADYLALQTKFVDKLKFLSIKLKNFPLSERKPIIVSKLQEYNHWINSEIRSQL
jgi:hypothetical protein